MMFIKGGNIALGLLIVPLTLTYVDSEKYGIWLALSSMVAWFSFFDIGVSNGLKNRLAEAFALQDIELGKKYVSTTYGILTMVFVPLMIVLLLAVPFVQWDEQLNINNSNSEGLIESICIIIIYFCINFILSTINTIVLAEQRPAYASLITFVQQLVSILSIVILIQVSEGSLFLLCLTFCCSSLFSTLLFNIVLFRGRYKNIRPQLNYIDFSIASDLIKLGVQFFIIQIAGIIQYQMINFLILKYYGGSEVTQYNISFKYFSVLTMVWGIMITPLWVAFTDAINKKDYLWIKQTINKYLKIYPLFVIGGLLLLLLSEPIYKLWIGDTVQIPFNLSLWILIYNLTTMFTGIYISFINGSGHLKPQLYACLITPFVFIITSFYCIHQGLPIHFIVIASILSNFYGFVISPIQTYHIIKHMKLTQNK